MSHQPPITPPPEMVERWRTAPEYATGLQKLSMVCMTTDRLQEIATQATQWGWDQRGAVNEAELLEACCELVPGLTNYLRAARRPNPPSLKEQALEAQMRMWSGTSNHDDRDLVRRALEQLPN